MAQGFLDQYVHHLLDYIFGGETTTPTQGAYLSPVTWYLGLLTQAPTSNGTGAIEVSAPDYGRIARVASDWEVAGTTQTRYITNTTTVNWPEVVTSGGWGIIVNLGLFATESSGTLRAVASLVGGTVAFGEGSRREIQPGELRIYLPFGN